MGVPREDAGENACAARLNRLLRNFKHFGTGDHLRAKKMPEFITVAKVGSIAEGRGASFQVGERLVAVFLHDGKYQAIDDLCPHMGASLGAGELDEDGNVVCPWHAWRFCVANGTWADNPRLKVDAFEVRIQGDEIQVRLGEEDKTANESE